jgi:[ribosomal protein S5]-alanine N-acetyltransferase
MNLKPKIIGQSPNLEIAELKCGIKGVLRPLRETDLSQAYIDGMNSPEIRKFLMQPNMEPQTKGSLIEYIRLNFKAHDAVLFGLFVNKIHRGNIRLHNITPDSAFLGIAIFDRSIWGKGWGSRAIRTVSDFGILQLKIKKISAGISDENQPSIRAFKKAGYHRQSTNSPNFNSTLWRFPSTF